MSRRICILRFDYFPQETHVRRNTRALIEAGWEVDLVCLRGERQATEETVDGVRVHRVPLERRRGSLARYLFEYLAFLALCFFRVARLHRRRRFHAVEVDSMPEFLVFAAAPAKWRGAKVALFIFDNMPEIFSYDYGVPMTHPMIRFMKWVERRCVRYADRVIVTHTDAREVLQRHGVPADRFHVVLNVPDETLFIPPAPTVRGDGRFTIVSHGSQLRRYGYDTLVRAVALIGDRIPELKVELIGGGKHRPVLMALAEELGVGHRFDFIPWLPFEEIPERIASADLAVVPILLELALPNKLFEYSAVKLPVVISDLHTLRDYYGDDTVRYFPPGDERALADAILELYHDPDRRRSLGEAAFALYRQRYAWTTSRRSYLEVYDAFVPPDGPRD